MNTLHLRNSRQSPLMISRLLLSVALIGLLAGCVTGRRTLDVPVPTAQTATPATKGSVYVTTITDDRTFQNKPSDPSIPSIDGDVNDLTPELKNRMIGRQRSGFGKAMGDIALSENETVTHRMRLLVEEALRRKGYGVSSDPQAPTSLNVSVDKFWSWMTPGFWALTFEVRLATKAQLTDHGRTTTFSVQAHGLNHGQVAKNGNWQEAFEPAFDQFIVNFGDEFEKAITQPGTASAESKPADDNLYTQLKKLDELRRDKILTEEEFQSQKQKLLEKN